MAKLGGLNLTCNQCPRKTVGRMIADIHEDGNWRKSNHFGDSRGSLR